MGLLRMLARESRAVSKTDLWGKGLDASFAADTDAGVAVSRETAVRLTAVYACVRLRAETVASLPVDAVRAKGAARIPVDPQPPWLVQPNPEQNWVEFMDRVNTSLDLDGNGYIAVTARDRLGLPVELWTLHPSDVTVRRNDMGEIEYVWRGVERLPRFAPGSQEGVIIHVRNISLDGVRGLSPIAAAKQSIGLGLAAERFGARFYGSGQQLSGVIEIPAGTVATGMLESLKDAWLSSHGGGKSHLPGVLTGGASWKPISINPDEAQFLETRKFQVAEIARVYGIPPHMIGDVDGSTSWGTGIEQQSIGFVQFSIAPRLRRLELAFNQLLPRGQQLKFNVNGLLRGDAKTRAEFYAKAIQWGWMTRADPRALEDMPPVAGLETPLIPANMVEVGVSSKGKGAS